MKVCRHWAQFSISTLKRPLKMLVDLIKFDLLTPSGWVRVDKKNYFFNSLAYILYLKGKTYTINSVLPILLCTLVEIVILWTGFNVFVNEFEFRLQKICLFFLFPFRPFHTRHFDEQCCDKKIFSRHWLLLAKVSS